MSGIGPNPLNDISRVYLESIAEKKDDTYLEPDMKKRQKNNEKARKDMEKMGTSMKNPHFEEKQQGWDAVNSLAGAYEAMHQDTVDEEKKKLPYVKMYRKAGNLGRDGSPEAMERSKKITGVMNKNAERVAAHREKDDAAKEAKKLRKEALDPVGKEDGDVNNDGKKDGTDKYLLNRRKAIGKAIKKKMTEEKKILSEEWVANNAAQYFFNEGLNEEGVEIFIEELGLESFVEFVHDLVEDSELIEAYALTGKKKVAKKLPKGTQPAKTTKATIARGDSKIKAASPSGAFKKRPVAAKAVETAKKQQPKKRSALDGIARTVLKGMDRHKKAMARAKSDIETTKKIASKVGKGAREFGKGVASGVKTAGKTVRDAKKAVSEQSNWRTDLSEVMTDDIDSKPIKEKSVKNKVTINPKLGESVEELGGEIVEMVEVDEFACIVEEVTQELIAEGFDPEYVIPAIEEATVTFGHDTKKMKDDGSPVGSKRRFLKRKAKSLMGKAAYKAYHAARDAKRAMTPAVQRMKTSAKRGIRKAALKVADKLKEENVDEAVYGGTKKPAPTDNRMLVTNADKKANTPAYQKYKAGDKRYKAADHMGEEVVDEKFSMAADPSKPEAARPTRKAENKKGMSMKSRAVKAIGTQRRQDKETGVTEEMSPQEVQMQKKKAMLDKMIANRRRQELDKGKAPTKAMGEAKELSVDDQMRISREANAKRKPYQPGDRMKQRAAQIKMMAKNAPKDTRTDAQKMTDATGPRPGSRYRGD